MGGREAHDGGRVLLFLGESAKARPLPAKGVLRIGRAPECDICIDDASVSRHHAKLTLGATILVEDLGSQNGTRILDKPRESVTDQTTAPTIEPRRLVAGEVVEVPAGALIQVGNVTLLVHAPDEPVDDGEVIAADPRTVQTLELVDRVAKTDVTVLLLGETGVGKEVMAARIHRRSARAGQRFLQINCAALPESLLESELFGYEQGAFTNAKRATPGLLESASGGTVLLDEIGELTLGTQAKFLRVLEEQRVLRLGAREPRSIDVRIVAATHRDLEQRVRDGAFREDLLFRINSFPIRIPALRERPGDIEPLARGFVRRLAQKTGARHAPELTPDALAILRAHAWPGNVRELRNVIERALVLCDGPALTRAHFDADRRGGPTHAQRPAAPSPGPPPDAGDLKTSMERVERDRILHALEQCAGNQTRAAALLGISRRMLVRRMTEYDLPRPRKDRG